MNEQIEEILARSRRIETKVTRMLSGEGDRGVTNLDYTLVRGVLGHVWVLRLNSLSITLAQAMKAIEKAGVLPDEEVDVYDNNRHMFTLVGVRYD